MSLEQTAPHNGTMPAIDELDAICKIDEHIKAQIAMVAYMERHTKCDTMAHYYRAMLNKLAILSDAQVYPAIVQANVNAVRAGGSANDA